MYLSVACVRVTCGVSLRHLLYTLEVQVSIRQVAKMWDMYEELLRQFEEASGRKFAKNLEMCAKCDCYAHLKSHVCFEVKAPTLMLQ
jgi:hypothetical protein